MEGSVGDDFFHFKGACSLHLEFLWSVHVEVGHLQPHLISGFPWDELRGNPFLHFLLHHLVGGLGVIVHGREF